MSSKILPLLFALAVGFATPGFAQAPVQASATTPKPSPKFRLFVQGILPPTLGIETEKLQQAKTRRDSGTLTNAELATQEAVVLNLERHINYAVWLESKGGSLGELLNTTQASGVFTLIHSGEPSDLEVSLPPFKLENVPWKVAIEVLSKLLLSHGLELTLAGGDKADLAEAQKVICVLRRLEPPQPARLSSQPEFEAFGLADKLSAIVTVDGITDAIRTAWQLDPKRSPDALRLQYHRATQILLVTGPAPAVTIARQVISSLAKK